MAQQFFWSPFIVFCRFGYSLVLFSVLIVSVKMESIEMSLNKCRLVNIFKVQNFLPLKSVKFVCGFWKFVT